MREAGRGDAGRDAAGLQAGASWRQRPQGGQAGAVVATVGDQLAGWRQSREHDGSAAMVAHLAHGERSSTTGRPWPSQTAWSLEVSPPLGIARCSGEKPLFQQAGRGAVRLEVGAGNHQTLGQAALGGQGRDDAVEHAHAASAHEAVVEGPVGSVGRRRITPAQTVADDGDDAALHAAVIHARNATGQREVRRQAAHLRRRKQERRLWAGHGGTSAMLRLIPRRVAPSDESVLRPEWLIL